MVLYGLETYEFKTKKPLTRDDIETEAEDFISKHFAEFTENVFLDNNFSKFVKLTEGDVKMFYPDDSLDWLMDHQKLALNLSLINFFYNM